MGYYNRSGVYIGSIGAGGFEVRPDGKFYRCQIFNDWKKDLSINLLFLHQTKNKTYVLRLDDLITPNKVVEGVNEIRYQGEFPKVKLTYPELKVEIEFMSIFIPGDIKNSSLPSVICKVRNSEGKLVFLFPSPLPSQPRIEKQKVFLKTDEGELGVYSESGKVFYFPQHPRYLSLFVRFEKMPEVSFSGDKGDFYAGILYEGEIEEEIIISWYFPDMKDFENNFIGHYYANYFKSCEEVMDYVIANKDILKSKTDEFYRSIYDTDLPQYLKDSYTAQLSSFVKESWLTKDGKFGVWEGSLCCCGLQTTDVAYYGSWLYVKMFPELERTAIKLTAEFQREDGWIPHFFPGTFNRIDEYRRKDMNMQFVLMVYRDYFLWKDKDFLKEMYPKLKKAILCVYDWDKDGDKIPDIEGPDQTFDMWGWKGCSIYLAVLWLAALRVGIEVGKLLNDPEFTHNCEKDFAIVKENIIKKLWNGKYFILWTDGIDKDEGCLLDALSGDWYCYLIGLGHILPEDMIRSHLETCLIYNKKKIDLEYMKSYSTPGETGWCYINGGYKDDRKYCFQQYEPWTGTEYSFAIDLYIMGMKEQALQVIKDVYDRKLSCGMVWNHLECGGDYFRPMVIGALWELIDK